MILLALLIFSMSILFFIVSILFFIELCKSIWASLDRKENCIIPTFYGTPEEYEAYKEEQQALKLAELKILEQGWGGEGGTFIPSLKQLIIELKTKSYKQLAINLLQRVLAFVKFWGTIIVGTLLVVSAYMAYYN